MIAALLLSTRLLSPLETATLGARLRLRAKLRPELAAASRNSVAIVPISEETLRSKEVAAENQRIARHLHGRLLDQLVAAGAGVVVFDLGFFRPSKAAEDNAFAAAIRRATHRGCLVVLAVPWSVDVNGAEGTAGVQGFRMPLRLFRDAGAVLGHTRVPLHYNSGVVDRIEPAADYDGHLIPALCVAAVQGASQPEPRWDARGQELSVPGLTIPCEELYPGERTFRIVYQSAAGEGPSQWPYETVLGGVAHIGMVKSSGFFRNRVVLVGDVTSLSNDFQNTPLGLMTGLQVHAAAIATLQQRDWLRDASGPGVVLLLILLLTTSLLVGTRFATRKAAWTSVSLVFVYGVANVALVAYANFILPLVGPCLAIALGTWAGMQDRGHWLERQSEKMSVVLIHYVSPQVGIEGAPQGRVTLVFTDLQDSSQLTREFGRVFEIVRTQHFEVLRTAAKRHHGFEIETAGDSAYLAFARPEDALKFAVEAQREIAAHRWPGGVKEIKVRIGMHTGEPVIALDRNRLTYRGHHTNLAARVMSKADGGEIYLSRDTWAELPPSLRTTRIVERLGEFELKGVGPYEIYVVRADTIPTESHNRH